MKCMKNGSGKPGMYCGCKTIPIPTKYEEQIRIVKEVMHNRKESAIINKLVKGVMIESYICPGNQKIGEHIYGKSITDPCLGWEESEQLLYAIADSVR